MFKIIRNVKEIDELNKRNVELARQVEDLNKENLAVHNENKDLRFENEEQKELKKEFNVNKVYIPNGIDIEKCVTHNAKILSEKQIYDKIKEEKNFTIKGYVVSIKSDDDKEIKVLNCHYKIKNVKERSKIIEITKDSFGITCNDGIIYLDEIKPFGKKAMTIKQYLNGVDKNALLNKDIK